MSTAYASRLAQETLLTVDGLVTEFANPLGQPVRAVDDISFFIRKGETLGIVGESGSGKSVTALSILQLIDRPGRILDGSIRFNSKRFGELDLVTANRQQLRSIRGNEIAMIFQEPVSSLNPVYTCGEQVMESLHLHLKMSRREARQRALELFERVRLPRPEAILKAYPHEISGGQKQRVMIAMALACEPQLIIADEPTTALDVTVQASILKLMAELRDDINTAVLFITHDLGVVAEVSDRVAVMYGGKIIESNSVLNIFTNPQMPYTKGLLACRPRLDVNLKVLPTISDFVKVDASGELLQNDAGYRSVGEALLSNAETEEEQNRRHLEVLKSGPPILEVEDLKTHFPLGNRWFGKARDFVKAVDGVSFKVYPGETLGLVGESGCGKTTLGRSLLRLIEPTAGEIRFQGQPVQAMKERELRKLRRQMQIVFQDPYASLNPRQTIGEAILEPMRVHDILETPRLRRDRVMYLLERVNLKTDYFSRYPHELSGGQRQRVSIARTLAVEPKFIICDESVSALDVSVQAQVLNLLNELKQDFGLTYIFISHDLAVVKFLADRIFVMNKGVIVESGYPNQLYEHPREAYTRQLIEAIPHGSLDAIRRAQLARKLGQKRA